MKIFLKENTRLKRFKGSHSGRPLSTCDYDMSGEVSTVAANSDAVIGITERTEAVVRGLKLVLEHHDASSQTQHSLAEQLHGYLDTSSSEKVWMARIKYVLNYPLAKYLRNELPPPPDQAFKPSGHLRRWMKARLNAFNRKNTHLWYSWLQAKRCSLSVSDAMVADAYKKHFSQLTQPDPCYINGEVSSRAEKILRNPSFLYVLNSIRKRINLDPESFTDQTPSTSACFENPRSKGGQYGQLLEICNNWNEESNYLRLSSAENPAAYLERTKEPVDIYLNRPEDWHLRQPFWLGNDELVCMYQQTTVRGGVRQRFVTEQYERAGRYKWQLLRSAADYMNKANTHCDATIQAVLEPLKIRIISKGSAVLYYSMKPLQKAIHSAMRVMPCFRLIGRPLCPTDLIDLIPDNVAKDDEWISVDYSAATDGLSSYLGMEIISKLIRDIPIEQQICARKVLGPHRLHYPVLANGKWGSPEYRGTQENGQLMGGILSFPILCLANLAVYLETKKIRSSDPRVIKAALSKVLVNGDDMLYVGNSNDWLRNIKVGKEVGLEMSIGKAYHHRRYANANSTSFICDLDKIRTEFVEVEESYIKLNVAHPYQINYLNVGLVFGQHKVQQRSAGTADSHHRDFDGVVSNIPGILAGSLPGKQSRLLGLVLASRKDQVRQDTECELINGRRRSVHHRNLFLPIALGGMGLDPPCGWSYAIKSIDRRLAKSLSNNQLSVRPLPGFEVESASFRLEPWIRKDPESTPVSYRLCQGRMRHVPLGAHHLWWHHGGTTC